MKPRDHLFARTLVCCDVAALLAAFCVAYWIRRLALPSYQEMPPFREWLWILWIIVPTWIVVLRWRRLYDTSTYGAASGILRRLTGAHLVASLVLLSSMYLMKQEAISRLLLQIFIIVSFGLLAGTKMAVKLAIPRLVPTRGPRAWKVLVLGRPPDIERYETLVKNHPHWGVEIVGSISGTGEAVKGVAGDRATNGKLTAFQQKLKQRVLEGVVDEVVAVSYGDDPDAMAELAAFFTERGVTFRIFMQMPPARVGTYHVDAVGDGGYLLSMETIPRGAVALLLKRLLDVLGAVIGLLLFGLAYIGYGFRLRRESPGPILFSQERVGQNGRRFKLLKFRTMYPDAERKLGELLPHNEMDGYMFKMKDDPRVTPTGRQMRSMYLDELPQFWNVLKGEMSLVGTRPPTVNEVEKYVDHHYRRLSMKPGLTGLWQLNGNGSVRNFEEVVKLDCQYIDKWSLWLDFRIIAGTLAKVARKEGY